MQNPLMESFSWLTPAFKFESVGKNKVRIKGIALKSDTVSRNMRHYVEEELIKSARTLAKKPINVNHDSNKIIGNVEWAEFENGALEYYGVISKQPYVDYIRNGDSAIKGVSVQATYLENRCPRCKQKFYSEEEFKTHMHDVEHLRVEEYEPHGIIYDALALVVSPEVPGIADTTVQLMETAKGISQLWETVTKNVEEKIIMDKTKTVAVETPTSIAIGPTSIKQPALKVKEQEEHECPEGEHWNEEQGKCVLNEQEPPETHSCLDGEHWDEQQEKCVPDEQEPPETTELKIKQSFVQKPKLEEIKLFEKLALAEPCDWSKFGYTSFEDCVASNSDKGDPEAYCGSLKAKEKLEIARYNKVVDAVNKQSENLQIVHGNIKLLGETFSAVPIFDWKPRIEANTQLFKMLKETIQGLPKDDLTWKTELADTKTFLTEKFEPLIIQLAEAKTNIQKLEEKFVDVDKKYGVLNEVYTVLKKEHNDYVAETEKKLKEMKEENVKLKEEQEKKLKETAEAKAIAEHALIIAENEADKRKGQFKGKNKDVTTNQSEPGSKNLDKLQRGR